MEFYIATNIQFVLQTKRRFMSFSPILILLNHTDNIVLWFWHKLNFHFCVRWFTIEHISEEGWINGNMYWGCIMHRVSVISAYPFHLCSFEFPSLEIHISYFCMSINICWGQAQCIKRRMHTFLQIIFDKFQIAICLKYR